MLKYYKFNGLVRRKRRYLFLGQAHEPVRTAVTRRDQRGHKRRAVVVSNSGHGKALRPPSCGNLHAQQIGAARFKVCRHGRVRQAVHGVVYRPELAVKRHGSIAGKVAAAVFNGYIFVVRHLECIGSLNVCSVVVRVSATPIVYKYAVSRSAAAAYRGLEIVNKSVQIYYLIPLLIVEVCQSGNIRGFVRSASCRLGGKSARAAHYDIIHIYCRRAVSRRHFGYERAYERPSARGRKRAVHFHGNVVYDGSAERLPYHAAHAGVLATCIVRNGDVARNDDLHVIQRTAVQSADYAADTSLFIGV